MPYIFGTQPGRKPVWVFLVENIRSMKGVTLWPKGGSTMVTIRQVGQALAGALERNRGGNCYPIGWYNMSWKEMLKICHKHLGCPDKNIVTIPNWMYALGGKKLKKEQEARGIEGGHWCPDCERKSWNYGQRAKVDPFFAQVWNPLHEPDELREYPKVVSELDVK